MCIQSIASLLEMLHAYIILFPELSFMEKWNHGIERIMTGNHRANLPKYSAR